MLWSFFVRPFEQSVPFCFHLDEISPGQTFGGLYREWWKPLVVRKERSRRSYGGVNVMVITIRLSMPGRRCWVAKGYVEAVALRNPLARIKDV